MVSSSSSVGASSADASSADASSAAVISPSTTVMASVPADIADLLDERRSHRAARDWAAADRCLDALRARGVHVDDVKGPDGTDAYVAHNLALWRAAAAARAVAGLAAPPDPTRPNKRRLKNRRKARHAKDQKPRSGAFAAWVVDTLLGGAPRGGAEVLDVAGGAGAVCWSLAVDHGVRCTVVDPRRLRLSRRKTNAVLAAAALKPRGAGAPDAADAGARAEWLDARALDDGGGAGSRAAAVAWLETRGLSQMRRLFDPSFGGAADEADAVAAWARCAAVTGLHPDEATEAIVDACLRDAKPFAVVPCCVFPTLFPHRRLRSGAEVRSREQLVRYLGEKSPLVRVAVLDGVPGPCNDVVYVASYPERR